MRNYMNKLALGAAFVFACGSAFAYKNINGKSASNQPVSSSSAAASQAKSANCAPALANLTMEFNDVSAFIEQGGSMFQDRNASVAKYEVPKGSGHTAIYAGALWMGGTDVNGQLKLAALTFRNTGNDFWPGPLTVTQGTGNYNPLSPVGDDAVRDYGDANIDQQQCIAYDKFFSISKAAVIRYNLYWECGNGLVVDGCDEVEISAEELLAINSWPAHGDVSLGQDYFLAPYYDRNGNGVYDPVDGGDYPWYDDILGRDDIECGIDRRISLFGDETHWWVFNDKGNIHTETGGDPIGMEIRAQAFAFATNDEINRMTFYNYEMINRGTQTLYNTYFSQYLDGDLGFSGDDYAGCDVSRGLGYIFNGDNFDEDGNSAQGYGDNPPAIGVDFFEGPYQDADGIDNVGPYYDSIADSIVTPTVLDALAGDGIVYSGIGVGYGDSLIDNERFGMRRFTYYTNGAAFGVSDPSTAAQFYNYMSGLWRDGTEMYYGGTGYGTSGTAILSDYMFPGDSDPLHWATGGTDPGFDWDETTNNNAPDDRRFVQSAGPFTLEPGAVNNITVGIVYGRGNGGDLFSSVDAMKRADTKAQALFDACFRILTPPDAPKLVIQELENQLVLMLENPSTSNNFQEAYEEEDEINITDPSVDRYYRFEGYQIYQLVDGDASISDITDNTKARLVAQCDIENDVDRIINFEFDEGLGYSVPTLKVDGENKGIRHSFLITEDQFAQGDRTLVNHRTYYYVAVAYAYNNFKTYDPNDPDGLDGQKLPYISSRLSFDGTAIAPVEAVPHNPSPEAGGTISNIEYGSSPIITREDGYGNGNRSLELTEASKTAIINTGKIDRPSYTYGRGPINVKVVDPLNVAGGFYELKFVDYNTQFGNAADTADWVIYRYASEGGTLLDSVYSTFSIDKDNEQIIPDWGVSVQINQYKHYIPETSSESGPTAYSTDFLEASISFADSSKRWLTGVSDDGQYYPTNWIRSGAEGPTDPDDCNPNVLPYLNPCNYMVMSGADDDQVYSNILNGTIAPHKLVGYEADYMPLGYFNYDSDAAKKSSAIAFLPSVDIVITNDKSKWSRCPVIELGRDPALTVGGAELGELRQSPSVDKNGNPDGSGTVGMGWFPGYAIDVESGARLYIMFGENSFLGGENGADMLWNPTDRLVDGVGTPLMGGMHPVYIFSEEIRTKNGYLGGGDFPAYIPSVGENDATNELKVALDDIIANPNINSKKSNFYRHIGWISYPLAESGYDINPNNLPTDVTIKIRVNKEYKNYTATGKNNGRPMYSWNMDDISTETGSADRLAEVLDIINVVPNPYYAYSKYERSRLDTRVKITNLPEVCTVKIFSVNGKLVRTFKKDSPVTSLDWDLNNHQGIPVAGGVYLIHVDVPGVGEKIVKFFGGMRQVDLQGI